MGSLARGGAERQALLLTTALRDAGVEAWLHAMAPPFDQLADDPGPAEWVLERGGSSSVARQMLTLARIAGRIKPEVIVTFLASAHVRQCLLRRVSRAAHGAAWIVAERGNTRFQMLRQSPLTFGLRMASFRAADRIVANSPSLGANIASFEPSVGLKLAVVPNIVMPRREVDREEARRALEAVVPGLDGAPLIGALGSFQEERNYPLLAHALKAVVARHPRAKLITMGRTAGGVFAQEARRFERAIRASGMAGHSIVTGEVADARRLLPAFDVVVLPSKLEGSSNALVEALAAGAAVATTPVADAESLVGGAAIVSAGWTPGDLASAICSALERAPELRRLARQRFERLATDRSARAMGVTWRRLFEEVLEERGSRVARHANTKQRHES